jgi:hypothetical protein
MCIVCLLLAALPQVIAISACAMLGEPLYLSVICVAAVSAIELVFFSVGYFPFRANEKRLRALRVSGIYHLTTRESRAAIMQGNVAIINASRGIISNLANWRVGRSAFFFSGPPSFLSRLINLCGRRQSMDTACVYISGETIPSEVYFRLLDKSILIPGGFRGVAVWQDCWPDAGD